MESLRDLWDGLDPFITTALGVIVILVVAVVSKRAVASVIRRAYASRIDRAEASGVEELTRLKRQRTLVTTIESLVRYGIYGAALVICIGLVSGGRSSAFFGASVVAVLVGFSLQRLLTDVLAGALLLFEGHFAVGDVITVHQHNVTGVVEEFALRTTSLRTFGGDRVTIMNGGIVSVTRWSYGQREHRIECVVRGEGAVARIAALCEAEGSSEVSLWVRAPRVVATEPFGEDGLTRVVVTVVGAPGQDELADRLTGLLEAVVGEDDLVGPVATLPLYAPTFQSWRAGLLLRD